jgi:hypothetical protein
VRRHFEASVSTPAVLRRCRGCADPVLAGLAEGIETQVDLTALDEAALVVASILGRPVFVAARVAGAVQLWRMTEWTPLGMPLVVEHVCAPGKRFVAGKRDLPAPDPSVAAHLTGWKPPAQLDEVPPY